MAWWRPWGAVGAIRNWGDWIIYGLNTIIGAESGILGYYDEAPAALMGNTGSVIGIGFIAGAFISACLGKDFAFRIPPYREMVKAVLAGILMGIGAALAGGCNVGGMYNAIGNLAANGFTMWIGLVAGVLLGLKLLYMEMEYISWGDGGSGTINIPNALQNILALGALAALIWVAYAYAGFEEDLFTWAGDKDEEYIASLAGIIMIAAGLGYTMQRGRWCMVQGFREPHMTGDGWGSIVGGFIFGLGAMLAGGCGSGTLWRVGEGQVKLIMVVPFFGIANSLMITWFKNFGPDEINLEKSGALGSYVYLPDVMGYGGTLAFIAFIMMVWYLVVTWNEDTNKLIVPM
jgi:uncharacterized membrane protein YedE/YeeE